MHRSGTNANCRDEEPLIWVSSDELSYAWGQWWRGSGGSGGVGGCGGADTGGGEVVTEVVLVVVEVLMLVEENTILVISIYPNNIPYI